MRLFVSGLAILVVLAVSAPAAANTAEDATIDAIVALQAEIMLLAELDAFRAPVPPEVTAIQTEWADYMEDLDARALVDWLVQSDTDGRLALDALVATGVQPSRPASITLERIPADQMDALLGGATELVEPMPYVHAIQFLEAFGGRAAVADPIGQTAVGTSSSDDTTTEAVTGTPTTSGVESRLPDVGTVPLWVIASGGIGLLIAIATAARMRRQRGPHDATSYDRLLDAGRRMTRATEVDEVARIAVAESLLLANADHCAYVHVDGDVMHLVSDADHIFERRRLEDGVLNRVADTGQVVNTVTHDEPFITALPAALLAVPIIGSGKVNGIITLIRSESRPFGAEEEAAVTRLAPMVGSATAACRRHVDLTELSVTDPLTSLPNRRKLDSDLSDALRSRRGDDKLAVVMIDVDHFKLFNDTNGHAVGDVALETVARVLASTIRSDDRAYRYGGEEFSLILHVTSTEEAFAVVDRARVGVAAARVPGAERQPGGVLTISAGIALVSGGSPEASLAAADAALYSAKENGRNRVEVAESPTMLASDHIPTPDPTRRTA